MESLSHVYTLQVIVPVGEVPATVLLQYHSLIARHRQVELQLVRSFYNEQQKSPFKFLPWKNGAMHFRFIPVRLILASSETCYSPVSTRLLISNLYCSSYLAEGSAESLHNLQSANQQANALWLLLAHLYVPQAVDC